MFRYRSPRGAVRTSPFSAHAAARRRVAAHRAIRGFTLVELMITLAVAGILMTIAIPSFRHITLSNRLSTTANDYVNAINTARMAAVKANNYAEFCSNNTANNGSDALGAACGTQAPVNTGGAVVVMRNSLSSTTPVADLAQAGVNSVTTPLSLNGDITALRFDGMGLAYAIGSTTPYTGPVAVITTSALSSGNCRIINMTGGTIVTTTNTDPNYTACN